MVTLQWYGNIEEGYIYQNKTMQYIAFPQTPNFANDLDLWP